MEEKKVKTVEEKMVAFDVEAEKLARKVFCKYAENELSCEDCTVPVIGCIPRIWARKIISEGYREEAKVQRETGKALLVELINDAVELGGVLPIRRLRALLKELEGDEE